MNEVSNPYVPGAGVQPPELSGRKQFLDSAEVAIARAAEKRPAKSFIIVGLRGVGKTVLLSRVNELALAKNCRVVSAEAHDDKKFPQLIAPHIRRVLLDLDRLGAVNEHAKKALRVFRSWLGTIKVKTGDFEFSLDVDPERGIADSGDLEVDLPELFTALGLAAQARSVAVILIIDEIQYLSEKELSAIVMAMHRVAQLNLPLLLAGAGLPLVVGKMGESKSYAERLFSFPEVGALGFEDASQALIEPASQQGVTFEPKALSKIHSLTRGYPYFIQEWGYVSWNVARGPRITEADVDNSTPIALRRLDESFFRVRFDRLTPREKQYLRAMAELGSGPFRSGDIAEKLGVRSQSLGPCRSSLISKGMIYSPAFGDTTFTVPLFDEYMRRAMPFHPWKKSA